MEFVLVMVGIIFWTISSAKEAEKKKAARRQNSMQQNLPRQTAPRLSSQPSAQPHASSMQPVAVPKREQMRQSAQWQEAKRKQDDAAQVHSIKMDSCDKKLDSLRVLYEAGILDREEYAQRMAKIKANHHS